MRLLLTILLLSFYLVGFGQSDEDSNNIIGYTCGYGLEESIPVLKIGNKVIEKDYKGISNLIFNGTGAEKFLSVVVLERLDSLNEYQIDSLERNQINLIKKSFEQVYLCWGCTESYRRGLTELFVPEYLNEACTWLDRKLKDLEIEKKDDL